MKKAILWYRRERKVGVKVTILLAVGDQIEGM